MATVPVRRSVAGLVATVFATVPGPLPLLPVVIVIHGALAVAFHEHVAGAVTLTLPAPPSGANVALAGAMVYEHTGVGSTGEISPPPQRAAAAHTIAIHRTDESPLTRMPHLASRTATASHNTPCSGLQAQYRPIDSANAVVIR